MLRNILFSVALLIPALLTAQSPHPNGAKLIATTGEVLQEFKYEVDASGNLVTLSNESRPYRIIMSDFQKCTEAYLFGYPIREDLNAGRTQVDSVIDGVFIDTARLEICDYQGEFLARKRQYFRSDITGDLELRYDLIWTRDSQSLILTSRPPIVNGLYTNGSVKEIEFTRDGSGRIDVAWRGPHRQVYTYFEDGSLERVIFSEIAEDSTETLTYRLTQIKTRALPIPIGQYYIGTNAGVYIFPYNNLIHALREEFVDGKWVKDFVYDCTFDAAGHVTYMRMTRGYAEASFFDDGELKDFTRKDTISNTYTGRIHRVRVYDKDRLIHLYDSTLANSDDQDTTLAHRLHWDFTYPASRVRSDASINQYSVFPNPASSGFTIERSREQSSPIKVRVLDLFGRKVYSARFDTADKVSLDVANISPGNYTIEIEADGVIELHKLNIVR